MNRDEAKAKIAKLMALGANSAANEHEAEAALRQAASLMRRHAIEQAELADMRGAPQAFDWSTVSIPADPKNPTKNAIGWIGTLAVQIAKFTDTKASWKYISPYGMCIQVQGEAVDVEYAAYLMKHLRDTISRLSAEYGVASTRRHREYYRRGLTERLGERMRRLKAENNKAMSETPTAVGSAMVIVDRKIAERDQRFGAPKYGTTYSRERSDAAQHRYAGRRAGDEVGFGRPLDKSASTKRIGGAA